MLSQMMFTSVLLYLLEACDYRYLGDLVPWDLVDAL
jgi:hypothetical protein